MEKATLQLTEIWKEIIGYEEYYQISNQGNIKSKDRVIYSKNGIRLRLNKSKSLSLRVGVYKMIGLNKNMTQTTFLVHRLVAIHFVLNPENKSDVNHLDGDKYNNNDWNLEWSTPGENQKHAYRTGLKKPTWKDKKLSDETRKRMSESKKGKDTWNKGIRQKEPTHGKMYEYNLGCRCDLCKQANTEYCRNKRNKYNLELTKIGL